ncbi:MAG: DUF1573 domain-containing protein [Bacteroidia bacterium]|nr:DUF1573 domain-containing protein [Bacteroidia bacterium]
MMNYNKFLVLFALVVLPLSLFAQGMMSFVEETHDFGNIEEGVVASYEFEFTNTGDQPLEIESVKASCGCTSPFWTHEVIYPGKTGKIKASYSSDGRPGPFTKSLTVSSNAKKPVQILYIKGFVSPRESTANQQEGKAYNTAPDPKVIPPSAIRVDQETYDFGRVETGTVVKQRFRIHNAGQQNLIITDLKSPCKCLNFGLSTSVITPAQTAILELSLDAKEIYELMIRLKFIPMIRLTLPKKSG